MLIYTRSEVAGVVYSVSREFSTAHELVRDHQIKYICRDESTHSETVYPHISYNHSQPPRRESRTAGFCPGQISVRRRLRHTVDSDTSADGMHLLHNHYVCINIVCTCFVTFEKHYINKSNSLCTIYTNFKCVVCALC